MGICLKSQKIQIQNLTAENSSLERRLQRCLELREGKVLWIGNIPDLTLQEALEPSENIYHYCRLVSYPEVILAEEKSNLYNPHEESGWACAEPELAKEIKKKATLIKMGLTDV